MQSENKKDYTFDTKIERFPWIKNLENKIKSSPKFKNEEIFNNRGFNEGVLIDQHGFKMRVDKSYTVGNKKLWVFYLPVPKNADSIGIKTTDKNLKEKVKISKYGIVKYYKETAKEIRFGIKRFQYQGLHKWASTQDLRNKFADANGYKNHYLIVSESVDLNDALFWNNLASEKGLWLVSAESNIDIIDELIK